MRAVRSIKGRELQQDIESGYLLSNGYALTNPAAVVSFSISAEVANARGITMNLLTPKLKLIGFSTQVLVTVYSNAAGTVLATTGGSTGLAEAGGSGIIMVTELAKKVFRCKTATTGVLTLSWTDTGTEAVYIGVQLPNGTEYISSIVQNA